jgi:hypothetical protein
MSEPISTAYFINPSYQPVSMRIPPIFATQKLPKHEVRFAAFTAMTMNNVVFWDVALCRSRGFFYPEDGVKVKEVVP